jgi:hypothetical protein
MSPPCRIEGELKLGANESNQTFVWYIPEQRWLTMEEFAKCEIGSDVKIVLKIQNEKVKSKNALPYTNNSPLIPFNNNHDFGISPGALTLQDLGLTNEEIQQPINETKHPIDTPTTTISDLFVGGAATIAMALSIAQQIRQKKNEAEASMCCNNNKMEISKFDMKLQKLETELKAKAEKDNKGLIAEVLETRKEIKEIKENFETGKQDIQKIIEIIDIQMKNKP